MTRSTPPLGPASGVCVGVLLLGAIVAAVALSPERVLGDIQLEPGGDARPDAARG